MPNSQEGTAEDTDRWRETGSSAAGEQLELDLWVEVPAIRSEDDPVARIERARNRRQIERDFEARLRQALGGRLGRLTLTRNRSTLISARYTPGQSRIRRLRRTIDVRAQRLFAECEDDTLAALVAIVTGGASKRDHISVQQFFEKAVTDEERIAAEGLVSRARTVVLEARGRTHHLDEIRANLLDLLSHEVSRDRSRPGAGSEDSQTNADRELRERLAEIPIGWGRGRTRRSRRIRSVQLGAFIPSDGVIRIHPILDQPAVPEYVVAAVVWHELLHVVIPTQKQGGRRCVHPPAFRALERRFPDHERAERWIDRNVFRLLARKR